jgi:site-specific DNA-methyltransferase (adenine-specific)
MRSVTRRGKGWTMHRAEAHAWLCDQPSASIDALITDPPYSSGGFTRGDRTASTTTKYVQSGAKSAPDFEGDNRDQRGFLAWAALWLTQARRVCRAGAPACVFSDWRQLPTVTDAFQAGGFVWRGVGVWTKEGRSRPTLGRFRADAEFVVWGSAGPMPLERMVGVLPGTWRSAPVASGSRVHITEKPVSIMRSIAEIAPLGAVVVDPFAGSGSTGVACIQSGRAFVGVEQDPHFFEVACRRLREASRA